jgi:predicted RND superfamily exporter protein
MTELLILVVVVLILIVLLIAHFRKVMYAIGALTALFYVTGPHEWFMNATASLPQELDVGIKFAMLITSFIWMWITINKFWNKCVTKKQIVNNKESE